MYSLVVLSHKYAESSCKLRYSIADSKGMSSSMPPMDIVITGNVEKAKAKIKAVGSLVYMA